MTLSRTIAAALLAVSAAGCAGDDPQTEVQTCTPGAGIGGAGQTFSPLSEGEPVVMVHGPQGGWHVEVGMRFEGLEVPVDLHWWIDAVDQGARVSESWLMVQPWEAPDDPCARDFTGVFGFLDVAELADGDRDTPPELLVGAELQIALEATGAAGETVAAEVGVVAEPDPADVAR